MIKTWINTTDKNIQFLGVTQGNTSFLFDGIDFFGNLNVWSHVGGVVINGEKLITVDNFLVGRFYSDIFNGIEKLGYTDPDGVSKEVIKIECHRPNYPYKPWIFMYGDSEIYDVIIGRPGIWDIRLGAFGSYEVFFTYADIKLP